VDDNEVNVRFGATIDDLQSKLALLGELFKGLAQGAKAELGDQLGGVFKDVGEKASGMNSIFKEVFAANLLANFATKAIDELAKIPGKLIDMVTSSIDAADHLNDLSQKTGIAADTLGGFGFAASQAGGTLDSAAGALVKLERSLAAAAAGSASAQAPFKAMNIEILDAAGNTKAADVVFAEVADKFKTYADGPEKAALAMKIFGKSGADLIPMLNDGGAALLENVEYYKRYSGVTVEVARDADAFNDTMGKLHLITSGFGTMLAAKLMPTLQEVANSLLDAREKSTLFQSAISVISEVFNGVIIIGARLIATLMEVGRTLGAIAAGIVALMSGNWAGVMDIKAQLSIDDKAAREKLAAFEQRVTSGGAGDGGTNLFAGQGPAKGAAPRVEKPAKDNSAKVQRSELALDKAEMEAELAEKRSFLKNDEQDLDISLKNNLVSIRDYYAQKIGIERAAIDASLDVKRREMAEAQTAAGGASKEEDRNKYLAQAAKLQGEINVLISQEEGAITRNNAARQAAEEKLANDLATMRAAAAKAQADDSIATEKKTLDQKVKLGQLSAEESFAIEKQLEDRSYAALQASLAVKRDLIKGDNDIAAKDREKAAIEEENAERAHQQKLGDIDRAATMERARYSIQAQSQIQGAFSSMVAGLLNGTKTMGDVFRDFANSIRSTFINLIAQRFTDKLFDATGAKKAIDKMVNFFVDGIGDMIAKFIWGETTKVAVTATSETTKTGAVVAGATARTVAETTSAAASTGVTATTAIANIGAKAWEAAASVYASIAAIPYVGPFLAPAMAIAAGAAVIGFIGNIASSEGGEYNVDQDRLNYVHRNETILPAPFAQGLRDLVGQGGLKPVQNIAETMENTWRMPANRLSQIQSPQAATAAPAAGGGRGGSGTTVTLPGGNYGNLFVAHRKDLQEALTQMNRNFAPKR
jgi:hypothetical protein